jgi:hypothetical protein
MSRTLLALSAGAALGVGATLLLLRSAPLVATAPLLPPPSLGVPTARAGAASAAPAQIDDDFYRLLATVGAAELDTMLTRAVATAPSSERDFTLALLLKRYSDLEPEAAVRRARAARVSGPTLGTVYGAWARVDANAALGELRTLDDRIDAAEAGAAMIEALGNNVAAIERVGAVLLEREVDLPATTAPSPVMTPAGPAPFGLQRSALQLMAQRWATLDPKRALALAAELGDDRLRYTFEAAGFLALTRTAPDEVGARLRELDLDSRQRVLFGGALAELVRADAQAVLAAAEDLPTDPGRFVKSAAVRQLAEQDPLAATRYLAQLPPGMERQSMTQLIARSYGKRDPAAALAWARALPEQNLVAAVIGGVAENDPRRALDLALSLDAPAERMLALQTTLMRAAMASDADAAAIADRVAALDDASLRNLPAMMLLPQWASRSPESATRWLLANGSTLSPDAFRQVGERVAARDPRIATAYVSQIPPDSREAWIRGVVQGYAQSDARGAVEWLGQFRAEAWYTGEAPALAMAVAQHDGAAAARLLDEVTPSDSGPETAMFAAQIANAWANRDPPAATEWALARPAAQRAQALEAALGPWTMSDPSAARAWVLRLPPDDLRNRALTRLLTMTASVSSTALDPTILNAFGSDSAREQAVLQTVQYVARMDAARARAIADQHLTDTALRAQADEALSSQRRGGAVGFRAFDRVQGTSLMLPAPAQSAAPLR